MLAQELEAGDGMLTQALFFRARQGGEALAPGRAWWDVARRRAQSDVEEVEIFLEAVELKEIGDFECADVAAAGTDFLLQVAHHVLQVLRTKAGAQELEPEPLTAKVQGELLAGELTVETVDLCNLSGDLGFVVVHGVGCGRGGVFFSR